MKKKEKKEEEACTAKLRTRQHLHMNHMCTKRRDGGTTRANHGIELFTVKRNSPVVLASGGPIP